MPDDAARIQALLDAGPGGETTFTVEQAQSWQDLSALAGATWLTELTVQRCERLVRLDALAGLTSLRRLMLLGADALEDLSSMPAMPALEWLSIRAPHLRDVSGLAGLTGLRHLILYGCEVLSDLSPVAGLTGLTGLQIDSVGFVDLSPLAGLTGLQMLDIRGCRATDLSPLAGLTALRQLQFGSGRAVRGLDALGAVPAITEDLGLGARGEVRQGSTPLRGSALYTAVCAKPEALVGLRSLYFTSVSEIGDLDALAAIPSLEQVSLSWCHHLTDASGLIALPALRSLTIRGSRQLSPRPPRQVMKGAEQVTTYKRSLARALKKKRDRTEREEAWFAAAEAQGLYRRRTPPRQNAPDAKAVRKLLGAREKDDAVQGMALLEALDDAALQDSFLEGVSIDALGRVWLTDEAKRKRHLRQDRRAWTVLSLMRIAGRLAGVTRIRFEREITPRDLSPLAAATALESLAIEAADHLTDLSFLAHVPQLQILELRRCLRILDLSPLAGLSGLRGLLIRRTPYVEMDLSPLAGLTGLTRLELIEMRLLDLAPLARLTNLQEIRLNGATNVSDYTPLKELRHLQVLGLAGCGGLRPHNLRTLTRGHAAVQRALEKIGARGGA